MDEPPTPTWGGETPLIFDWRPVRWRKTRLMVALAVAAAGHLLVFYLFQVVTESGPRLTLPVRVAMILPSTEESARLLLEGVEDRLPSLSQPVPLEDSSEAALSGLVKAYAPTWQDHRPVLRPLPGQSGTAPLPSLLTGATGVLPPLLAESDAVPRVARAVSVQRLVRPQPVLGFQSGLEGAALLSQPEWPQAVSAVDWPEEGPASFLLSVEPSGKVSSCLSLGVSSGLDEEEVELLRGVLLKLRFEKKGGPPEVVWGWVDVLW